MQQSFIIKELRWIIVFKRDCLPNMPTTTKPEDRVQWPQEGTCPKIPINKFTKWSDWKPLWPSG